VRYPYFCSQCDCETEIEKSLEEIDRVETCECGHPMARMISEKISFKNEKLADNQSFFHPALGCVVNSNSHAQKIARERGLIEIGDEKQDNLTPKNENYELSRRDVDDVFGIGELRGG